MKKMHQVWTEGFAVQYSTMKWIKSDGYIRIFEDFCNSIDTSLINDFEVEIIEDED